MAGKAKFEALSDRGTSERARDPLAKWIRDQALQKMRREAVQGGSTSGRARALGGFTATGRAMLRSAAMAPLRNFRAFRFMARGMPTAGGREYQDLTRSGRPLSGTCSLPGAGACSDLQPSGLGFCVTGQFSAADGSCTASSAIAAGALVHELQSYPVGGPINWRRGTIARWGGGVNGVNGVAIPAGTTYPRVPAAGRQPYYRPGDVSDTDGGPGLGWRKMPAPWTGVDPHFLPIGQPGWSMPRPLPARALPYRAPNPYLPVHAQPQWGPGTPSRPLPWEKPVGDDVPVQPTDPKKPEMVAPVGPRFTFDPRVSKPKTETQYLHAMRSPARSRERVKERKVLVYNAVTRVALKIGNMTTESCDAIDAFWKALPDNVKQSEKSRNLQPYLKAKRNGEAFDKMTLAFNCTKKAAALWRHWDKVNMRKAMSNLAENELEDRVIGGVGQRMKKLAHDTSARKVGIGYQAGGSLGKTPKGVDLPKNQKPWDGMFDSIFGV